MERIHPAEQSSQKKGLVSGWNPWLAAKSPLHCKRDRSSVSVCNWTLWGDSPCTIHIDLSGVKDSREDGVYAIFEIRETNLIMLTKSRSVRTKKGQFLPCKCSGGVISQGSPWSDTDLSLKWNRESSRGGKAQKTQVFQSSLEFSWKILTWHLDSSWPDGSSPAQHFPETWMDLWGILAMVKSMRVLASPYNRLPLVTLRKSLITMYLSFSREYNDFLFEWGVMRTSPAAWGPLAVMLITGTGKPEWVTGHIPFLWHMDPKDHLNQNITG